MFCPDAPQTARNHDGFMVTANLAIHLLFEGPEIPGNIRATKFVIESCTADGCLNHDIQG